MGELIGKQQRIVRENLLTTLDSLQKEFNITFEFNADNVTSNYGNILHTQTIHTDTFAWGSNIPSVAYHSAYSHSLRVQMDIYKKTPYYYRSHAHGVSTNKWHSVEISQVAEGSTYRYNVKLNGVIVDSVINNNTQVFKNVKVYASSSHWNTVLRGWIRKLRIR